MRAALVGRGWTGDKPVARASKARGSRPLRRARAAPVVTERASEGLGAPSALHRHPPPAAVPRATVSLEPGLPGVAT